MNNFLVGLPSRGLGIQIPARRYELFIRRITTSFTRKENIVRKSTQTFEAMQSVRPQYALGPAVRRTYIG